MARREADKLMKPRIWGRLATMVGFVALGFLLFPDAMSAADTTILPHALEFYIIAVLFVGIVSIALYRHSKIVDLQAELLAHQASEGGLLERALSAHAVISVSTPDGTIVEINQNFEKALGYQSADVVGRSLATLQWDRDRDLQDEAINNVLSSGDIWSGDNRMQAKDGSQRHLHCTIVPVHDIDGRHIKNISIRTDVTAERKARNDRFLTALLDHLQEEVFIYEVDTLNIRYVNINAMRRCDWTTETARQMRITESHPTFHEGAFRAHVAPLFDGTADSVLIETEHTKGPVEISTRLFISDEGQELFVSVLRDITERKKIERAKMEAVSIVSHELRTPLTSIKGALRLLKSGAFGPISEAARPIIDIADRNSERLLLVVNDILDLEKIRAGKMKFDLKPIDLVPFLADVVQMNKGYGDEHDVKIQLETSLPAATVLASEERMMQVMANIISNAAKFSPPQGIVRISLEKVGTNLRIGVTDSGPGIPENERDAVFESFRQVESTQSMNRKGTGLGLAISKKIVEAHRGQINFDSIVAQGTTFYVDLPALDTAAAYPGMKATIAAA